MRAGEARNLHQGRQLRAVDQELDSAVDKGCCIDLYLRKEIHTVPTQIVFVLFPIPRNNATMSVSILEVTDDPVDVVPDVGECGCKGRKKG